MRWPARCDLPAAVDNPRQFEVWTSACPGRCSVASAVSRLPGISGRGHSASHERRMPPARFGSSGWSSRGVARGAFRRCGGQNEAWGGRGCGRHTASRLVPPVAVLRRAAPPARPPSLHPALFTNTFIVPVRRAPTSMSWARAASSVMSHSSRHTAPPPGRLTAMFSAIACSRSARRAAGTTWPRRSSARPVRVRLIGVDAR